MFSYLESILVTFSQTLQLPVFVVVASFVEEVIAPIPSPTVMLISGSLARVQAYEYGGLCVLIVLGAFGKTLGGLVVYYLSLYGKEFLIKKFGRFLSVTEADIASFGAHLKGTSRDYVLLTLFRAFPFIPSVVLSVGSGVLKVPIPLFIASTFFGTLVRDGLYLFAGYFGTRLLSEIIVHSTQYESLIEGALVLCLLVYGIARLWRKYRTTNFSK